MRVAGEQCVDRSVGGREAPVEAFDFGALQGARDGHFDRRVEQDQALAALGLARAAALATRRPPKLWPTQVTRSTPSVVQCLEEVGYVGTRRSRAARGPSRRDRAGRRRRPSGRAAASRSPSSAKMPPCWATPWTQTTHSRARRPPATGFRAPSRISLQTRIAPGPSSVAALVLGLGPDQDRDLAQVLVFVHQLVGLGHPLEAHRPPEHRPDLALAPSARSPACTRRRWRRASR